MSMSSGPLERNAKAVPNERLGNLAAMEEEPR